MLSRLSPLAQRTIFPRLLSNAQRTLVNISYPSPKIAVLELDRPPVNSLSLEMSAKIVESIKEIESNPEVQAMVSRRRRG